MDDKKREVLSRRTRHASIEPGGFASRNGRDNQANLKKESTRISNPIRRSAPSRSARNQEDIINKQINQNTRTRPTNPKRVRPIVEEVAPTQVRRRPSTRISRPVRKDNSSLWKYIIKYGLYLASIGIIVLFFLCSYWIYQAPAFDPKILDNNSRTVVYDVHGQEIAKLGNKIGDNATAEEVPAKLKDAILATEDVRFNEHSGIDYRRLVGALFSNLTSGFGSQGGSTISQQLIKRTFLDDNKSIKRKVQEAYLAYKLEQNYDKDTIFNMYINRIYYSDGVYGLKTAARYYYDKELKDLTLPQMALLAGLPQQPNSYNPYDRADNAKARRDTVLYLMQRHEKISEEEATAAQQTDVLTGIIPRTKKTRYLLSSEFDPDYTAYMNHVEAELRNSDEFKDYDGDVLNLGLKVYTNLNPDIQKTISNSMDNNLANIKPSSDVAIVVLNNENSGISAIYGGKDFKFGGYNYATQSKLQPGSAIKPIFAYGPAIEYLGWSTNHILDDSKLPGSNIQNWDRKFHGDVTMNNAIKMSYNIPAIKTYQQVGVNKIKNYAESVGMKITDDSITTPIGGSADGYSPLQLAGAYVPFSNGGFYATPKAIVKVVDNQGQELSSFSPKKGDRKQVIKESTAYIMTSMLRNVLDGTASGAGIPGVDMGVKTGTTTFSEADAKKYGFDVDMYSKDSWIVGYTNKYTMAVWQGFDAIDGPSKYMTSQDTKKTQSLYRINMQAISSMYPPRAFVAPENVGNYRGGIKVLTAEEKQELAEEARKAEEERQRKAEEAKQKAEEEKKKKEEEAKKLAEESTSNENSTNSDTDRPSIIDRLPVVGGNDNSNNDNNSNNG